MKLKMENKLNDFELSPCAQMMWCDDNVNEA